MRVLCDCLTPYKQYMTEIIENVVDGISTPEDLTTENYPCEKTMERYNFIHIQSPDRFYIMYLKNFQDTRH